ncbi:ribbon-helix-helix domain-containing protein [Kordiimonas aestuarii]|uniref:ribbon-helix-helix domain-containing protein n=1 Tax=Kordiimonas aestuarii TaxID=1005925 RepID=UPI0021CE0FDD|nr:ribbon-helix-helix domain-containing protein [Kordiimonas aestuarii]
MYDLKDATLEKHSVTLSGHRTSISLEVCFWRHLRRIANVRGLSVNELVRQLDEARDGSLSGAIRAFVLQTLEREHSGN